MTQKELEAAIRDHNKMTFQLTHLTKAEKEIRDCRLGMLTLQWEYEEFIRGQRLAFYRTKMHEVERTSNGEFEFPKYGTVHNWEASRDSYLKLLHGRFIKEMIVYENRIKSIESGIQIQDKNETVL